MTLLQSDERYAVKSLTVCVDRLIWLATHKLPYPQSAATAQNAINRAPGFESSSRSLTSPAPLCSMPLSQRQVSELLGPSPPSSGRQEVEL